MLWKCLWFAVISQLKQYVICSALIGKLHEGF